MQYLGIIPARFQSTRFPGKPLCEIGSKPMIQRVYEQAVQVKAFDEVLVATDDNRIFQTVIDFGGKAVMTASTHRSGTERCAEVYASLKTIYPDVDTVVVNIQGDEPFIQVKQIEELLACFSDNTIQIATLIKKINNPNLLNNPDVVKAIISNDKRVLYFSRNSIPYLQNKTFEQHTFYRHIGLYAYKAATLLSLVQLPPSSLEEAENLEQLRWLENGFPVTARITNYESSIAIDRPEDIKLANDFYNKNNNI